MKEKDCKPGDIIQTANGNRFLVLPNRRQIYVGNKSFGRIAEQDTLRERSESDCEVVGKLDIEW